MPSAAVYRLFIKSARGLPYTSASLKVPAATPGIETVRFDIAMKRGVVVRGTVTDKVTGRPVRVAADYCAFANNPHLREYPGFSQSRHQSDESDEQGRYEVVALPGAV